MQVIGSINFSEYKNNPFLSLKKFYIKKNVHVIFISTIFVETSMLYFWLINNYRVLVISINIKIAILQYCRLQISNRIQYL